MRPRISKRGFVRRSICPSVRLSVCPSVRGSRGFFLAENAQTMDDWPTPGPKLIISHQHHSVHHNFHHHHCKESLYYTLSFSCIYIDRIRNCIMRGSFVQTAMLYCSAAPLCHGSMGEQTMAPWHLVEICKIASFTLLSSWEKDTFSYKNIFTQW